MAIPTAPAQGTWSVVDQIGGPTQVVARAGHLLLTGHGRRVEVFDPGRTGADEAPLLLGRSEVLGGAVRSLAAVGDRVYVACSGRSEVVALRLSRPTTDHATIEVTGITPTSAPPTLIVGTTGDEPDVPRIAVVVPTTDGTERETVFTADAAGEAPTLSPLWTTTADSRRNATSAMWRWHAVRDAAIAGDVLAVAAKSGVQLIDVSAARRGDVVGTIDGLLEPTAVYYAGERLYAAGAITTGHGHSRVVQIGSVDRAQGFQRIGQYTHLGDNDREVIAIAIRGDDLYLALDGDRSFNNPGVHAIERVDVRDPGHPVLRSNPSLIVRGMVALDDQLAIVTYPSVRDIADARVDMVRLPSRGSDTLWMPSVGGSDVRPSSAPDLIFDLVPWGGRLLARTDANEIGTMVEARRHHPAGTLEWSVVHRGDHRPANDSRTPSIEVLDIDATTERAAALILRQDAAGKDEIGLVTWTPDEDPARWSDDDLAASHRVAWSPFGYDNSPAAAELMRQHAFDRRFAAPVGRVLIDGETVVASTAVGFFLNKYDVADPRNPRLVSDDTAPVVEPRIVKLSADRLYCASVSDVAILRLGAKGMDIEATVPAKPYLHDVSVGSHAMGVIVNESLVLWRLDDKGLPVHDEKPRTISFDHASGAASAPVAITELDGEFYVITERWDAGAHSFDTLWEIDKATGQAERRYEFGADELSTGVDIVPFGHRLYVLGYADGTYVLERRTP